jgi:hypothetical protein
MRLRALAFSGFLYNGCRNLRDFWLPPQCSCGFALLGCYIAYVSSWLPTFRYSLSFQSSNVKQSNYS